MSFWQKFHKQKKNFGRTILFSSLEEWRKIAYVVEHASLC